MSIEALADFFMPQERKQGEDLFDQDVVSIGSASESQARAYVSAVGSPRVSFTSEGISSSGLQADCTCPAAKRGRLCKHIWAALLKLEASGADLLACKSLIEKTAGPPESAASLAAKVRQNEYKQKLKDQNKAHNKKFRLDRKKAISTDVSTYPEDVDEALSYFSANGFELSENIDVEALDAARKTLARVFHPDKGGTHEEILVLNKNYDVIAGYLGH